MTEYKHDSYGLVSFSRRQGNPKLFGSNLGQSLTQSYVTIAVRKATLFREDDGDRYYGSMRGDIIEVNLSAAQFAEVLTTMNVGMGTPCTIAYVNNQRIPDPPDLDSEAENIRKGFNKNVSEFARQLDKETLPKVKELLEKKTLSKADREQIMSAFTSVVREMVYSVPFTLELFEEATDKVVTAAKTEIDAFITVAAHQAGIASLKANAEAPTLALTGKSDAEVR